MKEFVPKVCCTCTFWSLLYKGLCERTQQGRGKFNSPELILVRGELEMCWQETQEPENSQ